MPNFAMRTNLYESYIKARPTDTDMLRIRIQLYPVFQGVETIKETSQTTVYSKLKQPQHQQIQNNRKLFLRKGNSGHKRALETHERNVMFALNRKLWRLQSDYCRHYRGKMYCWAVYYIGGVCNFELCLCKCVIGETETLKGLSLFPG